MALCKIVSGGQTGVDRGALDAALALNFPCGGWCPEGRRAEDGAIPERYPVDELPGGGYRQRTERNVIDSDATLVLFLRELSGGTLETVRFCATHAKPVLTLDAGTTAPLQAACQAQAFIARHGIAVLNVAGPRESGWIGARQYAAQVIAELIPRRASA
ncbi:MAG: putative molybdenum carrier protein [Betaproteobacteria bacterium]|nr:putative molybdenum carrier protein [Betaproteobacteria bacterium]